MTGADGAPPDELVSMQPGAGVMPASTSATGGAATYDVSFLPPCVRAQVEAAARADPLPLEATNRASYDKVLSHTGPRTTAFAW